MAKLEDGVGKIKLEESLMTKPWYEIVQSTLIQDISKDEYPLSPHSFSSP